MNNDDFSSTQLNGYYFYIYNAIDSLSARYSANIFNSLTFLMIRKIATSHFVYNPLSFEKIAFNILILMIIVFYFRLI